VTQEFLNSTNVAARFQKMSCETMTKCVTAPRLRDSRFANRSLHRTLDESLV
jgi:hypothetical protein